VVPGVPAATLTVPLGWMVIAAVLTGVSTTVAGSSAALL